MKTCSKCREDRPLDEFGKDRREKDGRQRWCKGCKRANHEANRESRNERSRAYREANRDQTLAVARSYYEDNRDRIVEQKRAYREANRDQIAEYKRSRYSPSPGYEAMSAEPHVLYRLFDSEGDLLYVGLTHDIKQRLREHRQDKPWWPEVDWVLEQILPDRTWVDRVETVAIRSQNPKYNKAKVIKTKTA